MTESWSHGQALRRRLCENLATYVRVSHQGEALRQAAVSVVVAEAPGGGASALLTRRPSTMARHSGQYALPGGKLDPGETPEQAALRELSEELGIEAASGQVLGALDDLPTRSGFQITPFVIWLPRGTPIRPDPDEVAAFFHIPLGDLFAGRGRGGNRGLSAREEVGELVFSLYIPILGHDVFAPTAAILDHFREVALAGRPTPIVRFGEPEFAKR